MHLLSALPDQLILAACTFPPSPTTPFSLLSALCQSVVTLSFCLWYFSRPRLPPSVSSALLFLLPTLSHHCWPLTIYLLIICQDAALLPLAPYPSPFYTFISCHPPPVGFFTLLFQLYFYSLPWCLCFNPLSPSPLTFSILNTFNTLGFTKSVWD